jgi:peptide/nickel transport system substrate-binding protein
MNNRSGWWTFVLFLLLFAMIVLQVLSMIQSDRLFERLNMLLEQTSGRQVYEKPVSQGQTKSSNLPMPKYPGDEGDWLIWQLSAEPRTLNTLTVEAETATRYITAGYIFERILEYDFDEAKLKPWLAESYEVSNDGLEITVKLRDGICFSDGVPMTADDIIFTYETIMNPGVDAAVQRIFYKNFKGVVKIDDRTVKFILNEIYWKTFEAVGLFEVLPKHIYKFDKPEEFNKRRSNPVGSGPYVFDKWDVGQQLVLKRNENYWGNKPKLKKIVFKFITNDTAALQALRSGDIDFMEPRAEQYSLMTNDKEFNKQFRAIKYWAPGNSYVFFIAWNEERPYLKDVRVRLAMTHIIDRETIAKSLLKGEVEIATGPFYIYGKQTDPNIKPWPYDLEKAAALLDEAGWKDSDGDGIRDKDGMPLRFKFAYSTGQLFYEQLAKLLKEAGAKVGIDVIPDPYEWSVFIERFQEHQFDALVIGSGGTIEFDPYQYFHSSQIADRGDNVESYSNPEVDKLLEEARRTLDEDKRYALYHKFHRIIHDEQPFTFLYMRPARIFIDKRFENVKVHTLGVNQLEWYVPKEKQRYK